MGELRRDIFHANFVKIERHNALGSWKMGVNEFSDLTQAEFEAQMTGGYKMMPQSGAAAPATTFKAKSRSELPDSVDWRDQGAVSEVKNQGQCGTDSTPMDGTACVGGPGNDEQHVCGQCGVLFDVSWPLG